MEEATIDPRMTDDQMEEAGLIQYLLTELSSMQEKLGIIGDAFTMGHWHSARGTILRLQGQLARTAELVNFNAGYREKEAHNG